LLRPGLRDMLFILFYFRFKFLKKVLMEVFDYMNDLNVLF